MIRFFGGKVLTLNNNFDITTDEVWVDKNKIVYVGPEKKGGKFEREINLSGNLLMPTFKNAHTHSAMTFGRSYSDDLPLDRWLNEKIFPIEAKLESEDIYHLSKLAFLEYLTSGITSAFDMYIYPKEVIQACVDCGVRIVQVSGLNIFTSSLETVVFPLPSGPSNVINFPVIILLSSFFINAPIRRTLRSILKKYPSLFFF